MPNNYSPPLTINYYGSGFNSSLIYYNSQFAANLITTTSTSFAAMTTAFTPNSINIPIAGDYIVTVTTGSSCTAENRINYQWDFSKAAQSNILVNDHAMCVYNVNPNVGNNNTFSRKVTFPVSGAWTLTQKWALDVASGEAAVSNNGYHPWIVTVHGTSPLDAVNTQLTQFLDGNYKLMTNVDVNAWWGNLTNTTVSGYGTSISSLVSLVDQNSTDINALTNTVSGLTNIATISGGVRIKP